jgi:hypothetical protein
VRKVWRLGRRHAIDGHAARSNGEIVALAMSKLHGSIANRVLEIIGRRIIF